MRSDSGTNIPTHRDPLRGLTELGQLLLIIINDFSERPFTLGHMQELVSRLFAKISTIRTMFIICKNLLPALAQLVNVELCEPHHF